MSGNLENNVQELWDVWNVRCAVLTSLVLQVVLTVLANSRNTRQRRLVLTTIIWLAYLLADWTAAFAVGLISSSQTNKDNEKGAVNKQLAAFWAPFLLLHLGGPDCITALSLEDNELWARHLFGLLIQLLAVVYVFIQSLPNEYWIPTALMFFAGATKYGERTLSLYRACLGNLKKSLLGYPDAGLNYAQFMDAYSLFADSKVPVSMHAEKEPAAARKPIFTTSEESLRYVDILADGYNFFDIFKGLVVDHMFSFNERNESRKYFFSRNPADAFHVMEVELNFMYDALYTKYEAAHSCIGYFFRFLCTTLLVVCFQQFASHSHRNIFLVDKIITYILLCGAFCLDLVGMYNLVVSDWSIVLAKPTVSSIILRLPFGKRTCRWSNTVFQHSFFNFCLGERSTWFNKVARIIGIKTTVDELKYKEATNCEDSLKEFLFYELKRKVEKAENAKSMKEVFSARGEWVLLEHASHHRYPSIYSSLSDEVEYDESLLIWHIATDLCYYTTSDADPNRKFCKLLSDYMLYLLVMRPTLMSAVSGIAQVRFQDTCEEARIFLRKFHTQLFSEAVDHGKKVVCKELLKVKTYVRPKLLKGDGTKTLLFDACILAKDLLEICNNEERWTMMSRIWVELMSYAAGHCRPDVHARQLSDGGELITFVWLLLVHFGCGEQFRVEIGRGRPKLIVGNKSEISVFSS